MRHLLTFKLTIRDYPAIFLMISVLTPNIHQARNKYLKSGG